MIVSYVNGEVADVTGVLFDYETYQFTLNGRNITNLLRRADKLELIEGFDVVKENERIFIEKYLRENGRLPPQIGPTSTWKIFENLILTDPLDAPLDALDNAVDNAIARRSFQIVAGVAVVVMLLYVVHKFE